MSNKRNKYNTNQDINKKKMLEALEKTLGIVTTACKQVGIGRATHYRWLEEDEEYRKAAKDVENVALDFAESKLHSQIADNNPTSTIFFLKTKGKGRGYIEKVENDFNIKQDKPFVLELSDGLEDMDETNEKAE